MSHFSSGGFTDRAYNWPTQPFFAVHHNIINNLAGSTHQDHMVQQDVSLSVLPQTSLGSMVLPDINTTVTPLAFASQVDSTVLSSNLFGHLGEIPPDFSFNHPQVWTT